MMQEGQTPTNDSSTPMPVQVLDNRYEIQSKIGSGGMATVYRAFDRRLQRTVAIKVMLPQYAHDSAFASRFEKEAQAAAGLSSPNIVDVHEFGNTDGILYIVMEYLEGTDLKAAIQSHGPISGRRTAQIAAKVCRALSNAHMHDIIHRDIKSQNIMILRDGEVKVMDFGIAHTVDSNLTTDNTVLGTAHYVSPEQACGRKLTPATDLYSLGVVMYECLTGNVPFDGDNAVTVATKQVNEQPVPPIERMRDPQTGESTVDPYINDIVMKLLQKNPQNRFQSAVELLNVLNDYLDNNGNGFGSEATAVMSRPNVPSQATKVMPRGSRQNGVAQNGEGNRDADDDGKRKKIIIGVAIAVIAVILAIVAVVANVAANADVQVPAITGKTVENATSILQKSDLKLDSKYDEEYSDDVEKGKIISQSPKSGEAVEKGTTVKIVVSKGAEPKVEVPDLSAMGADEAEAALEKLGLVAAPTEENSTSVEAGGIYDQSPAAGSNVKKGSTVSYKVSLGAKTVNVPDYAGQSEDSATAAIKALGLSVKVAKQASDTVESGVVISQDHVGKTNVGGTITITVSSGSDKVAIPYCVGLSINDAGSKLVASGFIPSNTYEYSDTVSKGTVISQDKTGKDVAGATVTLVISNGPKPTASNTNSNGSSNANGNANGNSGTSDSSNG